MELAVDRYARIAAGWLDLFNREEVQEKEPAEIMRIAAAFAPLQEDARVCGVLRGTMSS